MVGDHLRGWHVNPVLWNFAQNKVLPDEADRMQIRQKEIYLILGADSDAPPKLAFCFVAIIKCAPMYSKAFINNSRLCAANLSPLTITVVCVKEPHG